MDLADPCIVHEGETEGASHSVILENAHKDATKAALIEGQEAGIVADDDLGARRGMQAGVEFVRHRGQS